MFLLFFYFHAPSPPEIYTLSLHDALPISTFRPRPRFMDCRNEKGSGAMKKLFLPCVAVAALAVGAAPAAPASTATVQMKRSSFLPSTVTIKTGDTVRWVNSDTHNHQVVSNNGSFVSPILGPGKAYTHRFNAAGK